MESNIVAWKTEIATKSHLSVEDLAELEDHLRDEMEELQGAGLSEEEAFLVAARRMGSTSELAGELRQANLDKTWAQLPASEQVAADDGRLELWWWRRLRWWRGAGQVPLLFGVSMVQGTSVYAVNLSLFVILCYRRLLCGATFPRGTAGVAPGLWWRRPRWLSTCIR